MPATSLSKSEAAKVNEHLAAIQTAKASFNNSVVEIGRHLAAVKAILSPSEFIPWVGEFCRFSKATAYNYLEAHKEFGSFQRLDWIETECIYLLSRCEPAAKEAKALANRGTIVTVEKAREIIAKVKSRESDEPSEAKQAAKSSAPKKPDHPAGCITCGSTEKDVDGDCAKCCEPAVESREPGDDTEIIQAQRGKKVLDPNGVEIPAKMLPAFDEQIHFRSAVQSLGKIVNDLEKLTAGPAGAVLTERFQRIKTDLTNAQREIKFSMPYQVCPYCKGKGCKLEPGKKSPCRQTGWAIKGMKFSGEAE